MEKGYYRGRLGMHPYEEKTWVISDTEHVKDWTYLTFWPTLEPADELFVEVIIGKTIEGK